MRPLIRCARRDRPHARIGTWLTIPYRSQSGGEAGKTPSEVGRIGALWLPIW